MKSWNWFCIFHPLLHNTVRERGCKNVDFVDDFYALSFSFPLSNSLSFSLFSHPSYLSPAIFSLLYSFYLCVFFNNFFVNYFYCLSLFFLCLSLFYSHFCSLPFVAFSFLFLSFFPFFLYSFLPPCFSLFLCLCCSFSLWRRKNMI